LHAGAPGMTRTRAVAALWLAIGALVTGAGPARALGVSPAA
jgi:hypothetical protein